MYHKIVLVGNLGRDPQMRYTANGRPVTDFSMATSDKWTGQDGQAQERTIWWRVTVWGKDAENVNQILEKGSKVLVEARMTPDPKTGNPRMWTGQDGTTRASYEVTALTWKNIGSSSHGESHSAGGDASAADDADVPSGDESEIPF